MTYIYTYDMRFRTPCRADALDYQAKPGVTFAGAALDPLHVVCTTIACD